MNDPDLKNFLALSPSGIAPYADRRLEAADLTLPEACRPGVLENLALLRAQAALVVEALASRDAASHLPEGFAP